MINDQILDKYKNTRESFSYINANFSMYSKTYKHIMQNFDEDYLNFCEEFLGIIKRKSKSRNNYIHSLDTFIQLSREVTLLQARLTRDGRYEHSSYDDRLENVYHNKEVMDDYMDGLLVSQIFWPNHYLFGQYFVKCNHLTDESSQILDVPLGGGIYTYYLAKYFKFKLLISMDISPHSKALAEEFLQASRVDLTNTQTELRDVFIMEERKTFDFIVCGELLEHLEKPDLLLKKLAACLKDDGKVFLTTAIFAAARDHIYLFNNVRETQDLITKYFDIESELILPTALTEYRPEMNKEPINYACIAKKKD